MSRAVAGRATALVLVHPDKAALQVVVDGSTLLRRSVQAVAASRHVANIIVAAPPALVTVASDAVAGLECEVRGFTFNDHPVQVLALDVARTSEEVLVVHDGARGTVGPALVDAVIDEVLAGASACAPLQGVTDTVKRVIDGRVLATVDRETLVSLQTPQAFAVKALRPVSNSPLLLLDVSGDIKYIPGGAEAQRIPAPEAGVLAEALLRWRQITEVR